MVSTSVIGALGIFYTLLGVSLFVPIVAGLYMRARRRRREALAAIAAGVGRRAGRAVDDRRPRRRAASRRRSPGHRRRDGVGFAVVVCISQRMSDV